MDTIKVDMENLSSEEREQLLKLIEKSNKPKSKVFKPEKGERYFTIESDGGIYLREWSHAGYGIDKFRYVIGNCFKTKEEAKFMIEKLKVIAELKRFAEENNERELDWENTRQCKLSLTYDFEDHTIECWSTDHFKRNSIHFSSKEVAKKAVDAVGADRIKKYYFEVKE